MRERKVTRTLCVPNIDLYYILVVYFFEEGTNKIVLIGNLSGIKRSFGSEVSDFRD